MINLTIKKLWEFPGGPGVRTLCFHCQGFSPWWGNQDTKSHTAKPEKKRKRVKYLIKVFFKKNVLQDFPGGTVDKNQSASAGNKGLILGTWASFLAQTVKNMSAMQKTQVPSLGQKDALEKGMATHSSMLAWRIPWTEQPGGLQSMGSQRVRYN